MGNRLLALKLQDVLLSVSLFAICTLLLGSGPGSIERHTSREFPPIKSRTVTDTCETTIGYIDTAICEGQWINFPDVPVSEPGTYTDTLHNGNAQGCDSIVVLSLSILPPDETYIEYLACEGDGYVIIGPGGITCDESNPVCEFVFTGSDGCDSIVTILIIFTPTTSSEINHELCTEDPFSIVINGTTYNQANPTGTEYLIDAIGCDSIVNINLIYTDSLTGSYTYSGCSGDGFSVELNGEVFNEENPLGEVSFTSDGGCDSVVQVSLDFKPPVETFLDWSGCAGSGYELHINGTVYNESNPEGIEVFTAGCDSIVYVNLEFISPDTGRISHQGCSGDGYTIIVNGEMYNESNPTGIEIFQTEQGCDTVIIITMEFLDPVLTQVTHYICIYDEPYPNFPDEVLSTVFGCDSIVTHEIIITDEVLIETYAAICSGDTYYFQGQWLDSPGAHYYTASHPETGICDTTYFLELDVIQDGASATVLGELLVASPGSDQYQWVNCLEAMKPVEGAVQEIFKPNRSGTFAVITYNDACVDTSDCVGIEVIPRPIFDSPHEVEVFPNPSDMRSTILFNFDLTELNVSLVSVNGSVYFPILSGGGRTFQIAFSDIPDGMYFLQMETGKSRFVRKLIIQ